MFQVETEDSIYEVEFVHAQINITSRCNMRCEHCRGAYNSAVDLTVDDFKKIMLFSHQHLGPEGGYLVSGGEPLLHPKFSEFISIVRDYVKDDGFVSVTTNGTFLNEKWLDFMQSLEFPDLRIAISLDSTDPKRNNLFRHSPHAYEKSIQAIRQVAERENIQCIVRASIQKDQLSEMPAMVELVDSLGGDVLSISSIIPVGSALNKSELQFDKDSKKALIDFAVSTRKDGRRVKVDVNDPLAYINSSHQESCGEYGGCIAGIGTFSVEPDGTMLPCPVLPNQVITNIKGKTPEEILHEYSNSEIVRSLLERKFMGKCGGCELKFTCGGCRARAEGMIGNYLQEDPDCWL